MFLLEISAFSVNIRFVLFVFGGVDANGAILQAGDSVVLIKDLKVKGSSLVAKQGTAVRRISLDHENAKFIEGKVGPTQIVIITDYVKKMSEKE